MLGSITSSEIEESDGTSLNEKLVTAATDFIRNELGVKDDEIKSEDFIRAFPDENPNLQRVYVQLRTIEQAELCIILTRKLRKPELDVVLYIPRQLKQRFLAIKNEDYRLRKLDVIKHKTRVEYTEDDIVLYSCPVGHYRYTLQALHGLPAVDLAPVRTPPPGRKSKRNRSDSTSPNAAGKKKERMESSAVHDQDSVGGETQSPAAGTEQDVATDGQVQQGGINSKTNMF